MFHLLFIAIFSFQYVFSQSIIKVVQYPDLDLFNLNLINQQSGYNRLDSIKKSIDYLNPDILVLQTLRDSAASLYILDSIFNKSTQNFKVEWIPYFTSGTNVSAEALYYDSTKIIFESREAILDPNNTIFNFTAFRLKIIDDSLNRLIPLTIFSNTSGIDANFPVYETQRRQLIEELNLLMILEDSLSNFIYCNNMGFTGSHEIGYQYLLDSMRFKWLDPIDSSGLWHNSSQFSFMHTGCTRDNLIITGSCGSGLVKRGASMFISPPMQTGVFGLRYKEESYTVVANDGNRLTGESILDGPPNTQLPDSMSQTFYYTGNSLPITMEILLNDVQVSLSEKQIAKQLKIINPVKDHMLTIVSNSHIVKLNISLVSLQGDLVFKIENKFLVSGKNGIKLPQLLPGYYILSLESEDLSLNEKVLIN
ncbi:MAG: T9SS type A sorting domain-containing protein [Cytophagales bacterium]